MLGKIVKWGALAALVGAVSVGVLGKDRVKRAVKEAKHAVREAVDDAIDPGEEARLKRKLAALRDDYPRRIAALEGEVAELDREEARLAADLRLCERVLALCARDAAAVEARAAEASGDVLARAAALAEIEGVRTTYAARLDEGRQARASLDAERVQLERAIGELRVEHARLADEVDGLERELDAVRRNARLIEVLEKSGPAEGARLGAEELTSLQRVRQAIAERRAEQESRLAELRRARTLRGYERRALLAPEQDGLDPRERESALAW